MICIFFYIPTYYTVEIAIDCFGFKSPRSHVFTIYWKKIHGLVVCLVILWAPPAPEGLMQLP